MIVLMNFNKDSRRQFDAGIVSHTDDEEENMIVVTEYKHSGKKATKEPVKQYIPLHRIKRLSVMASEILLHI